MSSPRIVVLDGHTLNPGDLSWEPLSQLGACTFHERTSVDETVERCEGHDIVLTNKVVLDASALAMISDLRYIGVTATGYNVVDVDACSQLGITVTNVPAYSTRSVAQMVFAHILNRANSVADHSQVVYHGQWAGSPDFCFWNQPQIELVGMTMGIVGFGQIGQAVADLAKAFGMNVLVHTRTPRDVSGVEFVSLDDLFIRSDVVSLHCPLTDDTHHLVDHDRLATMKPTAWLINTGRGPLVDEHALAQALESGTIAAAGLDVLSSEPPSLENPLMTAPNCAITPHIAWATQSARQRLLNTTAANIKAYLDGAPQNVVS